MWKFVVLGLAALAVVVFGFSLINTSGSDQVNATALLAGSQPDIGGFARAIAPYTWNFPVDYGAHPSFQTEWWYYTGNLADESGQRFGYQFTIFRRAILPLDQASSTDSEWRTDQIYLAHFTITDVAGNHFYQNEQLSRGGAGLAGATPDGTPGSDSRYHVWLNDWQVQAQNDDATLTAIQAAADDVGVNFTLQQTKPPALEGDHGLSRKSAEPGNASYYYSLTRLLTSGTLTIQGQPFSISGTTWMDHEFSTSALPAGAQGWDWFGLQLDDAEPGGSGRELMLGHIRLQNGGDTRLFSGALVAPDGSTRTLSADDFTIASTGAWTSPHTQATYPSGWNISVNVGESQPLHITLTPLIPDQELQLNVAYWEGAVQISGDATGYGYVELTGYVSAMSGRF